MDRQTAKKMLNEFTVSANLKTPGGLLTADQVDRMIMQALKPLMDEGKALRQSVVNRDTGVRNTTYAYQGGRGINESLKGVLGDIASTNEAIRISEQRRKQYTQTQERIVDPRTAAAINADVLRMGGRAVTNKDTGITSTIVPSRVAAQLHATVDRGDQRYLSGLSSSVMGHSSAATPYEKAYGMVSRQENMRIANEQAKKDFIKANPNSNVAKEAQALADAEKRKKSEGAARLAQGTAMSIIGTITTILGTSVVILTKILGGVMETARATTKMMLDGTRFNLPQSKMAQLKSMATAMQLDSNTFSGALGTIQQRYGDVKAPSFGASIAESAPFFQSSAADLTNYITKKAHDPLAMYYQFMGDSLKATFDSRSGVQPVGSPDEAVPQNTEEVRKWGGDGAAEQFNKLYADIADKQRNNPSFFAGLSGAQIGEKMSSYMEGEYWKPNSKGEGINNGKTPNSIDIAAANEANRKIAAFTQIWEGFKADVFTKLVDYVGQILMILRNMLRPLLASIDPVWGEQENQQSARLNAEYTSQVTDIINSKNHTGLSKEKLLEISKAAVPSIWDDDRGAFRQDRINKATGWSTEKSNAFMRDNSTLMTAVDFLRGYNDDRDTTQSAGLWALAGAHDLKHITRHPFRSPAELASADLKQRIEYSNQDTQEAIVRDHDRKIGGNDATDYPELKRAGMRADLYDLTNAAVGSPQHGKNGSGFFQTLYWAMALNPGRSPNAANMSPHEFRPDIQGNPNVTKETITAALEFMKKHGFGSGNLFNEISALREDIGKGSEGPGGTSAEADARRNDLAEAEKVALQVALLDGMKVKMGHALTEKEKALYSTYSGTITPIDGTKTTVDVNLHDPSSKSKVSFRIKTDGTVESATVGPGFTVGGIVIDGGVRTGDVQK